jgi:hypothetical protein
LPIVRYNGPSFYRRSPDAYSPDFTRGEGREVSQAWVDQWRRYLVEPAFTLTGDEGVTEDLHSDGLPDSGWTNSDITSWLREQGVTVGRGYKTKSTLLELVDLHLNPPPAEPAVVEEPEPEPVVEENIEEESGE